MHHQVFTKLFIILDIFTLEHTVFTKKWRKHHKSVTYNKLVHFDFLEYIHHMKIKIIIRVCNNTACSLCTMSVYVVFIFRSFESDTKARRFLCNCERCLWRQNFQPGASALLIHVDWVNHRPCVWGSVIEQNDNIIVIEGDKRILSCVC